MIGLLIGAASGVLQFWLLARFVRAITAGSVNIKNMLLGLAQFFLPVGVLIGVAFIRREELLWAGVGIAGALLIGAVFKYWVLARKTGGRGNNND